MKKYCLVFFVIIFMFSQLINCKNQDMSSEKNKTIAEARNSTLGAYGTNGHYIQFFTGLISPKRAIALAEELSDVFSLERAFIYQIGSYEEASNIVLVLIRHVIQLCRQLIKFVTQHIAVTGILLLKSWGVVPDFLPRMWALQVV